MYEILTSMDLKYQLLFNFQTARISDTILQCLKSEQFFGFQTPYAIQVPAVVCEAYINGTKKILCKERNKGRKKQRKIETKKERK